MKRFALWLLVKVLVFMQRIGLALYDTIAPTAAWAQRELDYEALRAKPEECRCGAVIDTFEGEVWRAIPGWERIYEASSLGRIRSLDRVSQERSRYGGIRLRRREGRILAQQLMSHKLYYFVPLHLGGETFQIGVHRLICMAFHGLPPGPDYQTCHYDGNGWNNRAENVRWDTPVGNASDKIRHGHC